ncbi:hypothetical protein C0J52_19332 [Blattella germanica]|nr:hypothetical protein C0J52_19332 [Blattella germanica]
MSSLLFQDCPEASADFRAEQCAEFNAVPLEGRYYKWVPYTKAPNKCELNCMPKGDRFYYRHKRKVIDGTRCDEEKLDICVDGQCMPVGCDMMLGSTAREDNCRECGGDGSSYNDILLIPAGATNIQVREIKASNNYLAIRNVTGHYYLNGNWRIDFPRSLKFAGTIFHYERKPHGFFAPESLSALGPTSEPIYIVLLYQETNPGVHYEYSIPKGVAQQTDPDSYSWITDEFSECSATCGGGYQTRRVQCARRKDLQVVADYLCDLSLQPQSNQTCSADPCPPQWFVSAWGPCSETCGEGGIQVRQVYCEQIVSGGRPSVVDDSLCIDILAHKPPTTQKCSEDVPCPQWHVGPWKPCNRLCGEGHQKRNVRCFRRVEGKIEVLGDSACPIEKPEDEKPCEIRPCEGVDWVVSDWSGCEDKCGLTQETRRVHCANQAGKLYPDEYCHAYRLPELTRSCESPIPCEHEWFASQWSECSAHCGVGVKTRKVFCGEEVGDTVKKVPDEKCDLRKKYEAESNCTGVEECTGQWYTGPWSACSVPCGGGRMTRKVLCYVENATVDIKNCDPSLIHFASETCNNNPCTDEEDEEEECEDDIEGSLITMETTLGLGVTPIAGGTGKQEIDFEGSGGVDFDKLEFEEGTSESPSSDVSIEATDGMLLSTASDTLLGTASPSEISSSSVSEGVTDLTDLMLSDSAGTSFDSTDTTGSGDEETSEDAKSTDVTSSDDTKATDFTSSEDTASTDVSSKLSSLSTDGESSSSTGSETSGSTVEGTSSSVDFTSSSLESSSISPTVDSSGATESSVSSESSSSGSSVQSSSSDSSPSSASTEPSVSMSSELTSEEGSGMTGTTDLETDITTLTGSGIPFFGEVEEGSGETITSIEESSTVQTHISSTSATESSLISGTEISSTSATEISSSSETSSTVEAESSQTEVSETVESSSVYTSESSPDVSGTSESGASTDGSSTITVLTTESSVLTSESPLSTAESPVTEPTSETESTVSPLSTESDEYTTGSTEEYTSTEVSGESSAEVEEEIKKTTLTPAEIAITKEQKVKKCKRKKKKPKKEPVKCETTEFGCCPDGKSVAQGPFSKGCAQPETCQETEFGCCPDGVSPAEGKKFKGCPPSFCAETLFGCCPDGVRIAEGNDLEGCEEIILECKDTDFGCCPDGHTAATGPNNAGCFECEGSGECDTCQATKFGCCSDGVRAADGPDGEGCEDILATEEPEEPVDCSNSTHGCCPDGIKVATGPYFEGCGVIDKENCSASYFGCCPDGQSPATGPRYAGCRMPCEDEPFGCCNDTITPAHGPNQAGCCLTTPYGCCPDNIRPAQGPQLEGCGCENTEFGCCPDDKTPSPDVNKEGCGCEASKFGCCPDGSTEAQGDKFEGCKEIPVLPGDACFLPKIEGPCEGYYPHWYYDAERKQCGQFIYGGCLGNNNRFETREECDELCVVPDTLAVMDSCVLPKDMGPCPGSILRWYFDLEEKACKQFMYGGCQGNGNRFKTEEECKTKCHVASYTNFRVHVYLVFMLHLHVSSLYNCSLADYCALPRDEGNCTERHPRWFFDASENRCMPFYYSGCGGNDNRFQTQDICEADCPARIEWCFLPDDHGPCSDSMAKWFYDSRDGVCKQFLYGGCQGNQNKFTTREECEQHCGHVQDSCYEFDYGGCQGNANRFNDRQQCEEHCRVLISTAPAFVPSALTITTQSPFIAPEPSRDICAMPVDTGPCDSEIAAWYYNKTSSECHAFIYGGCGGNANRFESEEQCERQCGDFKGQDVCNLPADIGPCRGNFRKWFYNPTSGECEEFGFGGCQGNGNRFSSLRECEHICLHRDEPQPRGNDTTLSNQAICRLPVDTGPCSGHSYKRWYYDDDRQTCIPFIYSGCAGNRNRFKNFQSCLKFCAPDGSSMQIVNLSVDLKYINLLVFFLDNVIDVESPPEKPEEDPCLNARLECNTLRCPYGVEKYLDNTYCERCQCHDPCKDQICPGGTECAVDLFRNPRTGSTEFRAACRSKPTAHPAEVIGEDRTYVVVTLGAPTILQCYAVGWPPPTVTWWRGDRMLPFSSEQYEQRRDYSLLIRSVTLRNLGHYTCQAYNGYGRAASWTVTVQAVGPVYTSSPGDSVYNEFLIPSPKRPDAAPEPIPTRPSYPFRPVRPPGQYRPRPSPTPPPYRPPPPPLPEPTEAPEVPPEPYAPEREDEEPSRVFTVPVQTTISLTRTVYPIGSDISIPCDVDGYPIPHVVWYKDDELLEPNERIQITENHRLRIVRANGSDAGSYKCSASNQYGSHSSTVSIAVEGIYIHPNCTDNPFFANCKLIVEGRYCTHKYYARFCCKSCTQAGQLPSDGPHLDKSGTLSNSRRK